MNGPISASDKPAAEALDIEAPNAVFGIVAATQELDVGIGRVGEEVGYL
jgi:hypothetical protein